MWHDLSHTRKRATVFVLNECLHLQLPGKIRRAPNKLPDSALPIIFQRILSESEVVNIPESLTSLISLVKVPAFRARKGACGVPEEGWKNT